VAHHLSGTPGTDNYLGPWAPYEEEPEVETGLSEEQRKVVEDAIEGRKRLKGKGKSEDGEESKDSPESGGTSIFHGKQLRDYQGRSYVDPPTELKNVPHDAYQYLYWWLIPCKYA
jgi:pre-mRNA-processing factor 17